VYQILSEKMFFRRGTFSAAANAKAKLSPFITDEMHTGRQKASEDQRLELQHLS